MSQCDSPLSPGAVVFFESYLHVVTDVALVLKVSLYYFTCVDHCLWAADHSELLNYEQYLIYKHDYMYLMCN